MSPNAQDAIPFGDAAEVMDDAVRPMVAMVVDDSASQRRMLSMLLKKWKFDVIEAEDGVSALAIFQTTVVDIIISDWMMPEMTGPDLCRAIRQLDTDRYAYIILLTSRRGKDETAMGLDSGADDYLIKPVDMGELHARLRAGQRLLDMQEDLFDKNRRITEAFDRLAELYENVDRDLKAAARLQQSLIPERQSQCGPVPIGTVYQPVGHVGGDLLGFFKISDERIAVYSIDVSGHGVSSALLTARLSNFFAAQHLDENIAVRQLEDGSFHPRDPADFTRELNDRLQDEADTDQYFTMLFADLNLKTGMVRFCQAGHPNPAIIRANGEIEFVGNGGSPIGLIPDLDYDTSVVQLGAGDRMFMFTDGITECENPEGQMLENEGLQAMLERHAGLPEADVLDQIMSEMTIYTGRPVFDDDVSGLLLTMPELMASA